MAVSSNALTTLARQKTFLEIRTGTTTYDSVLENLINSASKAVESYLNRTLKRTSYSNIEYDGTGSHDLFVDEFPIKTSETFTIQERDTTIDDDDWTTIDAEDYFIYEDEARIHWVTSIFRDIPKHYRVSYTAGYYLPPDSGNFTEGDSDSLPADLEMATWMLVAKLFRKRRHGTGVSNVSIEGASVSFRREIMVDSEIGGLLDKYKDITIV